MESGYEKRGYLLEDFRLFHLRDAQGVKTEYHYHEFCKLLLLLSGSGSYTVEGLRYPLSPGDLVLLNSHCIHKSEFEPGRAYERVILYISPELLRRESTEDCRLEDCFTADTGPVLRLPEPAFQQLRSLIAELEQELDAAQFGPQSAAAAVGTDQPSLPRQPRAAGAASARFPADSLRYSVFGTASGHRIVHRHTGRSFLCQQIPSHAAVPQGDRRVPSGRHRRSSRPQSRRAAALFPALPL